MWFLRYHWSNFEKTRGHYDSLRLCLLTRYSVYLFFHVSQAIYLRKLIRINLGNWSWRHCSSMTVLEDTAMCRSKTYYFPLDRPSLSLSLSSSLWLAFSRTVFFHICFFNLWWICWLHVLKMPFEEHSVLAQRATWAQTAPHEALRSQWEAMCVCVGVNKVKAAVRNTESNALLPEFTRRIICGLFASFASFALDAPARGRGLSQWKQLSFPSSNTEVLFTCSALYLVWTSPKMSELLTPSCFGSWH